MSKKAHVVIAILAGALFAWAITRMDASMIARQGRATIAVLPIVLALIVLRLLLQSLSWSLALRGESAHLDDRGLSMAR